MPRTEQDAERAPSTHDWISKRSDIRVEIDFATSLYSPHGLKYPERMKSVIGEVVSFYQDFYETGPKGLQTKLRKSKRGQKSVDIDSFFFTFCVTMARKDLKPLLQVDGLSYFLVLMQLNNSDIADRKDKSDRPNDRSIMFNVHQPYPPSLTVFLPQWEVMRDSPRVNAIFGRDIKSLDDDLFREVVERSNVPFYGDRYAEDLGRFARPEALAELLKFVRAAHAGGQDVRPTFREGLRLLSREESFPKLGLYTKVMERGELDSFELLANPRILPAFDEAVSYFRTQQAMRSEDPS